MQIRTPTFIASTSILWLRADGTEVTLTAAVGAPYPVDATTWACPASLDGLDGRYPDMYGEGSMQALSLALRLIAKRLAQLLDTGERLVSPEDRTPWNRQSLADVFGEPAPADAA